MAAFLIARSCAFLLLTIFVFVRRVFKKSHSARQLFSSDFLPVRKYAFFPAHFFDFPEHNKLEVMNVPDICKDGLCIKAALFPFLNSFLSFEPLLKTENKKRQPNLLLESPLLISSILLINRK